MATTARVGREFVLEVIECYRDLPCLWNTNDKDYHDKNKRMAALAKLTVLFKTVDPEANKETAQKKIASLRGAFKKENNKVKASILSGAHDLHVPKLWYYEHMLFLEHQDIPRKSKYVSSILDAMPFGDTQEVKVLEESDENSSPQSSEASSFSRSRFDLQASPEPSQKRPKVEADAVLNNISSRLDERQRPRERPKLDAFGQHVAEELRSMPELSQKICMKIISDALFQGAMGNLNVSSHIVN